MDLLQRELARKKAALANAHMSQDQDEEKEKSSSSSSRKYVNNKRKKKYMKQSEIRRLEEEEEEKRQQATKRQKQEAGTSDDEPTGATGTTITENSNEASASSNKQATTKSQEKAKSKSKSRQEGNTMDDPLNTTKQTSNDGNVLLSPVRVAAQLRAFGLPIRFFGETHAQRLERLETALAQQHLTLQGLSEMEEFRLGQGHGIRNPFLGRDDNDARQRQLEQQEQQEKGEKDRHAQDADPSVSKEEVANKAEKDEQENGNDIENEEDDPPKRVYKFLKGLLKNWESDLEARPSSVAKSVAGRNESKTLKQCKDYIRPLFKQLKRRRLESGLQAHLVKIVEFAQQGEFVKAHDAYLDVAIGRAAWPIGVTMVGIHARSGRAKIESSNVAHVMNSELQRKYLTSVKRLLSYAQKKRTDVDPSKKVT